MQLAERGSLRISQSSDILLSGSSKPLAFSMEPDGTVRKIIKVDNPDFGNWAYINGKFIIIDKVSKAQCAVTGSARIKIEQYSQWDMGACLGCCKHASPIVI